MSMTQSNVVGPLVAITTGMVLAIGSMALGGPPCERPTVQTGPMTALNAAALDFALEDREVRAAADSSTGAIVVAWAVNQTLGPDYDLFFARSSDGGATWSTPAALNSNASTDTATDRFASLAAGSGTFVAVWESTSGAGTDLDIRFARSTDGGQTWSAVAPLNSNAGSDASNDHDSNARVATDEQGSWICVWNSNDPSSGTTGFDQDVFFSKSIDDGVTWSAPALIDAGGMTDSFADTTPVIASDGGDAWIACWYNGLGVFRSDDDGQSWESVSVPEASLFSGSIEIACDSDGHWLIATTRLSPVRDIFLHRSVDGGLSWSAGIRPIPDIAGDDDDNQLPKVAFDSSGVAAVVWSSQLPFGGGLGFDREIIMCASTDFGLTWGPPTSINDGVLDGQAEDVEPTVVPTGNGEWLLAWRSTNPLNGTIGSDYDIICAHAQVLLNADCNGNSVGDGCEIIDGDEPDQNNDGILDICQQVVFPNASLTEVLRTGDPAPGGGVFGLNFGFPICEGDADTIIFRSGVPDIGMALVMNEAGLNTILVAAGQQAPSTPAGTVFSTSPSPENFLPFDINRLHEAVFQGELSGPGVTFENRTGVWIASRRGVSFVVRGEDAAPGLPPGTTLVTSNGITRPRIGDSGTVLFRADLAGPTITSADDQALWRWQNGTLEMVAREGSPAPGTAFTFRAPEVGEVDNSGHVYFGCGLNAPGNPSGVWRVAPDSTTPVALALPGQQAPGLPAGTMMRSIGGLQAAAGGTVVIISSLEGGGVGSTNDLAMWSWSEGDFTLIVRKGDAVPGTVGLQWSQFGIAAISAGGRIVISASSSGSAGQDHALWLVTPNGLRLIVRAGAPAQGTFPPTFFDFPFAGTYVFSINDDADVLIGWEAGLYGWRENYGLFYIASDGASAVIDGEVQAIVDAYLPAGSGQISWNLDDQRSFVFRAIFPASPVHTWGFVRGTLPPLADITADASVNIDDLLQVISEWGPCATTPCSGDCTHDGTVNIDDLLLVISQWG